MGNNLARKILAAHLVSGEMIAGKEIALRIDQTLTQDASGTTAYLQFEAIGIPRVRTEVSVSYVDHNMLQTGFENADDHRFLQSIAAKFGVYFSRPGNGICHQVHAERFAVPGKTLLGSDSHTPLCGGLGMIAIGAGGLDVAVAMGGDPFYLAMPKILGVKLTGKLQPWVSGKDVILELLRRLTVKGGVGKVVEYYGPGVATLDVIDRITITNMGAELGATTSVFPSDERTRVYLKAQNREETWLSLAADPEATYDEYLEIDLDTLEPLIAQPHSPDKVVKVSEVAGLAVQQVSVGSCTNSSYRDLSVVAHVLRGKSVHPGLSLTVSPGSRQVYTQVGRSGALADMIGAGARMLESACGPCIGMGMAPPSNSVAVRSFNRNFEGRSGTRDAKVYLASPETCAATAITGVITDPRTLGEYPTLVIPERFETNDALVIPPIEDSAEVEVIRGPNIKPLPRFTEIENTLSGEVILKVGDNITTDHISPAGTNVLPLRSNLPALAEFTFERVDKTFAARARAAGRSFVVGGTNYGQGSAREHAALAPRYLGVQAVLAISFARIHRANLVNFGVVPLLFANPEDYTSIAQGDQLEISLLREQLQAGEGVMVRNLTTGIEIKAHAPLSTREEEILLEGGLLSHIKRRSTTV
ncbi:MAG: aconitate hydratase [Chloroflexi bacterium]|nr:aconitate hydratase [Chloroflexota bacterium]